MLIKYFNSFGQGSIDLEKLVHRCFPIAYELGQPLTNTDVIETNEFIFIATHFYEGENILQRYFLIALAKNQFNKVVFSDSNCIDPDKYRTAHATAIRTQEFFKHILSEYDYEGTGVDYIQRNPPRTYKKFNNN